MTSMDEAVLGILTVSMQSYLRVSVLPPIAMTLSTVNTTLR